MMNNKHLELIQENIIDRTSTMESGGQIECQSLFVAWVWSTIPAADRRHHIGPYVCRFSFASGNCRPKFLESDHRALFDSRESMFGGCFRQGSADHDHAHAEIMACGSTFTALTRQNL